MRSPGTAWFGSLTCALLAACSPQIPDGVFKCEEDRDCPAGKVCRSPESEGQKYCFAHGAGAGTGSGPDDPAGRDGGPAAGAAGGTGAGRGAGSGGSSVNNGGTGTQAGTGGAGAEVAPTTARFSELGEPRRGDGIVLYEDGFTYGERLCTADGSLCATGGFEP